MLKCVGLFCELSHHQLQRWKSSVSSSTEGCRFFRFPRVHRVHIGFLLRTIFAIEINGKNRPPWEFRHFPLERLELKRYGYVYTFLRLGLAQFPIFVLPSDGYWYFWRFFAKFIKILLLPKESFPHTFDPKIPFQVVWVPQTLTLSYK